MSSNIRITRICQHCRNEFTARTTVTKFCGENCAKRAYKARQKTGKIAQSETETAQIILAPTIALQGKDFLNIFEAAKLLGVSRWTVARAIKDERLPVARLGRRVVIKRADIDKLFLQTAEVKNV
ncbi:MAG: helix-turn-helix domain-containing protein [Pyrinomonadaceae bacterium]